MCKEGNSPEETRTEPSEGTVAINLLLSWLIKLS